MTKKKEDPPEIDPFMGGEDDDLSDMEYVQDEKSTMKVETHPPETEEDAKLLTELKESEVEEEVKAEEEVVEDGEKPEEEEVKAEEEAEPVVLEDEDPIKVPKDRFDEVNDRMKKAEDEVRSLKTQLETVVEAKNEPEPEPYDYAAKEKEAMDALLEGDAEKHAGLRQEIRSAEKEEILREARAIAAKGDSQLQETLTFEEAGANIEANFPQFSESDENYNAAAREELMDLYVGYARSGQYTRVQALQRAADKAAKMHGLTATTAEVPNDEPAPDNVVDIKPTDAKKKADVANAQPPAMESRAEGENEEPRVDVNSMSDEEFDSLPESSKRRLRGDIL